MKNTKDNIIQEQEAQELLWKVMNRIGPIPKDKYVSPQVINKVMKSNTHYPWRIGQNINLEADVTRPYDRLRFFEYGITFVRNKSSRGDNFEGLLAGLCKGQVIEDGTKPKEDILVNGPNGTQLYSVKIGEAGTAQWDSGSLKSGWKASIIERLVDLETDFDETLSNSRATSAIIVKLRNFLPENEKEFFKDPISLIKAAHANDLYYQYAKQMLKISFVASDGVSDLDWIFGTVYNESPVRITYQNISSESLIGEILDKPSLTNQGRNHSMIRIIPFSNPEGDGAKPNLDVNIDTITFPDVKVEEIEKLIYKSEGDREIDLVARIFPGSEHKVHHDVLNYIKDNPVDFQKAVNRIIPQLTPQQVNELYEGVCGDQEKHTGEQGRPFYYGMGVRI